MDIKKPSPEPRSVGLLMDGSVLSETAAKDLEKILSGDGPKFMDHLSSYARDILEELQSQLQSDRHWAGMIVPKVSTYQLEGYIFLLIRVDLSMGKPFIYSKFVPPSRQGELQQAIQELHQKEF